MIIEKSYSIEVGIEDVKQHGFKTVNEIISLIRYVCGSR